MMMLQGDGDVVVYVVVDYYDGIVMMMTMTTMMMIMTLPTIPTYIADNPDIGLRQINTI